MKSPSHSNIQDIHLTEGANKSIEISDNVLMLFEWEISESRTGKQGEEMPTNLHFKNNGN